MESSTVAHLADVKVRRMAGLLAARMADYWAHYLEHSMAEYWAAAKALQMAAWTA